LSLWFQAIHDIVTLFWSVLEMNLSILRTSLFSLIDLHGYEKTQ